MNDSGFILLKVTLLIVAAAWFLKKTGLLNWENEDYETGFRRGFRDGYTDGSAQTYRKNFETGFWESPGRKVVWKNHPVQWIQGYGEGYEVGYRKGNKRVKPAELSRNGLITPQKGPEYSQPMT